MKFNGLIYRTPQYILIIERICKNTNFCKKTKKSSQNKDSLDFFSIFASPNGDAENQIE